jgi:hypothetical protein
MMYTGDQIARVDADLSLQLRKRCEFIGFKRCIWYSRYSFSESEAEAEVSVREHKDAVLRKIGNR